MPTFVDEPSLWFRRANRPASLITAGGGGWEQPAAAPQATTIAALANLERQFAPIGPPRVGVYRRLR